MIDLRIKNIGTERPTTDLPQNELRSVVVAKMNDFVDRVRLSLTKKDKIASRGLWQSVSFKPINVGGNSIKVQFLMDNYWEQVDKGLKGKRSSEFAPNSPMQVGRNVPMVTKKQIELWAAYRSIPPKVRKRISLLIARKVNNRGYKPSNFYSEVMNDQNWWKQFYEEVEQTGNSIVFNEAVGLTKDQQKKERGL